MTILTYYPKSDGDPLTAANVNESETLLADQLYENLWELDNWQTKTFTFPIKYHEHTGAGILANGGIYPIYHIGMLMPSGTNISEFYADASGLYGGNGTVYLDYSDDDTNWTNLASDGTNAALSTLGGEDTGLDINKLYIRVRSSAASVDCTATSYNQLLNVTLKYESDANFERINHPDWLYWSCETSSAMIPAGQTYKQKRYYAPKNKTFTGFYAGGAFATDCYDNSGSIIGYLQYSIDGGANWVTIDSLGHSAPNGAHQQNQIVLYDEVSGLSNDQIELRLYTTGVGTTLIQKGYGYLYFWPVYSYTTP